MMNLNRILCIYFLFSPFFPLISQIISCYTAFNDTRYTIHPYRTTLCRFLIALCTLLIWWLNSIAQNIKIGVGKYDLSQILIYTYPLSCRVNVFLDLYRMLTWKGTEMKNWLIRGNSRNWFKIKFISNESHGRFVMEFDREK